MGFSLKNLLEEAKAQVNPFDHGQTAATVKAQRAATAPATLPGSDMTSTLSPDAADAIRHAKYGIFAKDPNAADQFIHDATVPKFDWKQAVIPTLQEQAPRVGEGVALGALRSLTGTAQGAAGLYDLVTPGTGTSRASDWLDTEAQNMDQTAAADGLNPIYKPAQAVTDAAQFLVPGVGYEKAAAMFPKVAKVTNLVDKVAAPVDNVITKVADNLASHGAAGRIAAKGVEGGFSTNGMVNAAAGTAQDLGIQSGKGEDISPTTALIDAGTNLAAGIGMSAAPQAAVEAIKSIKPTTKLVANTAADTARKAVQERKAAMQRTAQDAAHTDSQARIDAARKELTKRLKDGQAAGLSDNHRAQRAVYQGLKELDQRQMNIIPKAQRTGRQAVTDKMLSGTRYSLSGADSAATKREVAELDRKIRAFGDEDSPAKQTLIDRRERRMAELSDDAPADSKTIAPERKDYLLSKASTYGSASEFHDSLRPDQLAEITDKTGVLSRGDTRKLWEEAHAEELRQKAAQREASRERRAAASERAKQAVNDESGYEMRHRPRADGARAHDLTEAKDEYGDNIIPKDMYDNWYGSRSGDEGHRESIAVLKKLRGNPDAPVTIYRGAPANGDIKHGDWVSLSKSYAQQHIDSNVPGGKVFSKQVKAKDVRWAMDDLNEFGYFPEKESAKKHIDFPSKPNGKLDLQYGTSADKKDLLDMHISTASMGYGDLADVYKVNGKPAVAMSWWGDKLAGFAVHPDFQGTGLSDRVIRELAEDDGGKLKVVSANDNMRRLLKRVGDLHDPEDGEEVVTLTLRPKSGDKLRKGTVSSDHALSDSELHDIIATHRKRFGDDRIQVGDTGEKTILGHYKYKDDMITLASGKSNSLDTFNHESIHKAIGQFLPDHQIERLYKDIVKVRGGKRTLQKQYQRNGYDGISWRGAAEEEIANTFIDFAKHNVFVRTDVNASKRLAMWAEDRGLPQSVANIFWKLGQQIDKHFGKGSKAAQERLSSFYQQVKDGDFSSAKRRSGKYVEPQSLPTQLREKAGDAAVKIAQHPNVPVPLYRKALEYRYGKMPSDGKLRIDARAHADDLSPEQNQFIAGYAEMLKYNGEGNGVDVLPDGRRVSNNVRSAELKGKNMTNTDWFDEARHQIETGKAMPEAIEEYKAIGTETPLDIPEEYKAIGKPDPVTKKNLKQKKSDLAESLSLTTTPKTGADAVRADLEAAGIAPPPKPGKGEATSKFPARVGQEERAQPIRESIDTISTHKVKANDPVMAGAAEHVARDEDGALAFAKRADSTEANATAITLLNKYLDEGRHEAADELLQAVAPRFTRQGQETQILAAYARLTPAGAVRYAHKQVDRVVSKTAKGQQLDNLTGEVHKQIQDTAKGVAQQIGDEVSAGDITRTKNPGNSTKESGNVQKVDKTPEQRLADRIKASSERKASEPDPITDMVNTLHKVAKEVLPDEPKKIPRDPMQLIGAAIHDKKNYNGVYGRAKDIVREKYKDNPEALAELDKYFNDNPERTYSRSQLEQGVSSGIKDGGIDLGKLVKEHYSKVDAAGTDLKEKLIQRAGLDEAEAGQLADDIQKRYDKLVADKKESILKQMFGDKPTPEQVGSADRILQLHNLGAMSRDELRPLVAKKLGLPGLTPEATKRISDMAKNIQTLKEGAPERARATAEMMQYIEQQKPQSKLDNVVSIWKAGLLSGVKTQQGNPISNGTFAVMKKSSDPAAAVADQIFAAVGKTKAGQKLGMKGERTLTATGAGYGSGMKRGAKSGYSTLRTGLDERTFGDKYEQHAEINLKNPMLQKVFGQPANIVFRGMSAADQPFYYGALKNSLYDQAYAAGKNRKLRGAELKQFAENMVKNPSQSMAERATVEARKAVLGYDTMASKAVSWAHKGIDSMDDTPEAAKKVAHAAINVIDPFVKVPAAFISRTVDFTPLGIGKEVFNQIAKRKFDQRSMSQAIGEATTGTAILALGAALSKADLISGDYPKNDPKEQQRWKAERITPNSVKIGDTWVSMNYFGSVGLLFNAAHNYVKADGESATSKAGAAIAGLGQGLLGQSFLQGFSGFADAVQDPQRSAKSFINSEAGSVIPSWMNDVANVTDKWQRQTDTPWEAVKNRVPGLRESNKKKQDVYGNDLQQPAGNWNTLNGVKPSSSATEDSPVLSEVARLHAADPNNADLQVTPTPVKTVNINGTVVKLDNNQKYQLQKAIGQETQKKWGELIKSDEYQALDDTSKAKALNNLRTDVATLQTRQYVTDNNLGTYDKAITSRQDGLANGASVTSYANVSGSGTDKINSGLDGDSKGFLAKYNAMSSDARDKAANEQNDFEYKAAAAKYANDKANGKLSKAEDIKQRAAVAKERVGAGYSKQTRDLYGLNKSEVYSLITTDPDGNNIAKELIAYGDALEKAGISDNKFRTSAGSVSFNPKASGGSGSGSSSSSNSYALFGSGSSGSDYLSLSKQVRSLLSAAHLS